jgi:hypothetical protein
MIRTLNLLMKGIIRDERGNGVLSPIFFREIPILTGEAGKEEQLIENRYCIDPENPYNQCRQGFKINYS